MLFFLALQIADQAVRFVEQKLGDLDNGKKKEAAIEFARTELLNLQAAGKLGRRNDGTDTVATVMPLISEAIDVAVLMSHTFQKRNNMERADPAKAAIEKVKPAEQKTE